MNVVPVEFVRVMPEDMRAFVFDMYRRVEMSRDRARLMAELLVGTDIRGVFSHGTRQSARYLRLLRDGDLNPNPDVSVVHQTPTTGTICGDGGLGHFAFVARGPPRRGEGPGLRAWRRSRRAIITTLARPANIPG